MKYFNTILFSRSARFFLKDKTVPDKCFAVNKLIDFCDCKYVCKYKPNVNYIPSNKMAQCTN